MVQDIPNVKLLGVYPGQDAPLFAAETIDGKPLKLDDFRGKVVLIDFWATWCAPCVAAMPEVKKAYEEFRDAGFTVISISFDKDAQTARDFAQKQGLAWPQVWASGADKSDLAKLYGVGGIPATFLVGPDGKVLERDLTGEKLTKALRTALRKEQPTEVIQVSDLQPTPE